MKIETIKAKVKRVIDFFDGKKTYLVVGAALILGTLQGTDIHKVSEGEWIVLGFFGLGTMRVAVAKLAKLIIEFIQIVQELKK